MSTWSYSDHARAAYERGKAEAQAEKAAAEKAFVQWGDAARAKIEQIRERNRALREALARAHDIIDERVGHEVFAASIRALLAQDDEGA